MSDYYRVKILDVEDVDWPSLSWLEAHFGADFSEMLFPYGVEDRAVQSFEEFRSRIVEHMKKVSLDEAIPAAQSAFFYEEDVGAKFVADPTELPAGDLGLGDFQVLAQNLLAEAFPGDVARVPLRRVRFQAAQIHSDAGMPETEHATSFCLRVLTEAYEDRKDHFYDESPIYQYFEQFGADSWAQADFGNWEAVDAAHCGIIASAECVERVELVFGSDAFWEDHDDAWWATDRRVVSLRKQYESDTSEVLPIYVGTYEVVVHPAWIPHLHDGVFDSRAY